LRKRRTSLIFSEEVSKVNKPYGSEGIEILSPKTEVKL
jgi:hypothetical protein